MFLTSTANSKAVPTQPRFNRERTIATFSNTSVTPCQHSPQSNDVSTGPMTSAASPGPPGRPSRCRPCACARAPPSSAGAPPPCPPAAASCLLQRSDDVSTRSCLTSPEEIIVCSCLQTADDVSTRPCLTSSEDIVACSCLHMSRALLTLFSADVWGTSLDGLV